MDQYNDVLSDLQDYMLYEDNMIKSLRMKIDPTPKDIKDFKQDKNIKKGLFIPNQQDTLFWCFYIIKNGDIKYETLPNKSTLLAKQLKIEMVDITRKNKDIVKLHKFDTISNIESNLANDNNLSIKTFFTLCAIHNINVIYVKKNTYYELLTNDSNIIYILYELENQSKYNKKYGFELANEDLLYTIRNTFFKLDSLDKPIKAISTYNLHELVEICNKLSINVINESTSKQKSKKELYESIIQYF